MKHIPIISENTSACTCKRWDGKFRGASETVGAFTVRANNEHREHARAMLHPEQTDLFGVGDLFAEPFTQETFQ